MNFGNWSDEGSFPVMWGIWSDVGNFRMQSITVFWVIVIVIDWTDQKWNVIVIVFDYIANLIIIDDYFHD